MTKHKVPPVLGYIATFIIIAVLSIIITQYTVINKRDLAILKVRDFCIDYWVRETDFNTDEELIDEFDDCVYSLSHEKP